MNNIRMETSILSETQKYAGSALFALALHHSQIHQKQPTDALISLNEEPIGEGASANPTISVSDNPNLWIHEKSGLLLPVFKLMGVDDQAWHGLKETAGLSTQRRHHIGSFVTLLSEKNDGVSSGTREKELALLKAVDATMLSIESSVDATMLSIESSLDATMLSIESSLDVSKDSNRSCDYETKCRHKSGFPDTTATATATATDPNETSQRTSLGVSNNKDVDGSASQRTSLSVSNNKDVDGSGSQRTSLSVSNNKDVDGSASKFSEKPIEEGRLLSEETKLTVLYELLSSCVSDDVSDDGSKGYDARHRVALRLLATWLDVKWIKMEAMEIMVASSLMVRLKKEDAEEVGKSKNDNYKRAGMIGAAALTGGSLIALTGGLAAPAIGHGLGALASAVGVGGVAAAATVTGSFGAAGAGLAGNKMAKKTEGLDEFEFTQTGENHNQGRLAVGILISGIVFEEEDFLRPWESYNDNMERYVLKWESKILTALNSGIRQWLTSKVASNVTQGGAMLTVLSTLVADVALPAALVTASDLIDGSWAIAVDRSDKAGQLLAELLLNGLQGNRPMTLVGFSLGARVILKCLQCLAETEGDNAGLVERVVLLGAPVPIKDENWEDARKMVAGRFINVYYTNDWTLGVIFRASVLSTGLAGIQAVEVQGIENVDATEFMEGHSSYLWMTEQILRQLDLDNYNPTFRITQAKPQQDNKTKQT